ncbi:Na+:H+ antiporter, NhaC family [Dethiosulfatibacter aminovorans DSM 17477]|uniref:Na+:H+ antiporter, NhaC family n=1 Tax=Dethiosulfatibacter aminovorans DSM 17477 TaxID=1121476 RepID=A0A1M6JYF3_9FIRM|nr:Na+/H+ antiporter NhaC [Dethiosulfatibacter aminovorans]SHJ51703.1 Na+:H+ antiporter, NhaC family [Dethiosulfatibacter aminovorans DSM 17477]
MDNARRKPTIIEALIPVILLVASIFYAVFFVKADAHIPLLLGAVYATLLGIYRLGYTWDDIEKGILKSIDGSMQASITFLTVGLIIGTWILSGTVPAMIYYGLKVLSPKIFLVASCIMCSVVSLATGSSWTTVGTIGIALMGIGGVLGVPLPIVAGSIISGAYFGDKMSPLSDTTNLAPAMAGTTLFEHIKHMVYTTVPSMLISLILYGFLSMKYSGSSLDPSSITKLTDALSSSFNISLALLIPPIAVIVMVVMKKPAIPVLIIGAVLGGVFAAIFQGATFGDIISAAHYGYYSETGIEVIDNLLTNGGLDNMMWTLSLMLCAMVLGGVLDTVGVLEVIANGILKFSRGVAGLIGSTVISCIAVCFMTGDQYLGIVIPGKMYKPAYEKMRLHPKNLSRCLEDSGTLISPLVPWSSCGAYMSTMLGVSTFAYLPFTFLCLLNPIISILYGITGFSIEKLPEEVAEAVM